MDNLQKLHEMRKALIRIAAREVLVAISFKICLTLAVVLCCYRSSFAARWRASAPLSSVSNTRQLTQACVTP